MLVTPCEHLALGLKLHLSRSNVGRDISEKFIEKDSGKGGILPAGIANGHKNQLTGLAHRFR